MHLGVRRRVNDSPLETLSHFQDFRGSPVGILRCADRCSGMSWRTVDIMRLAQLNSILSYSLYKRTGERPTKFYPAVCILSAV